MLKKQMKTLIMMVCMCSLVFLAAEGTNAFFTAEEKAHNVITTGGIEIDLTEWSENEDGELEPFEDVDGIVPGEKVSKIVIVENIGESDAYIRVSVDKMFVGFDGEWNNDVISIAFNTTDWIEKDGYYYYNKVLKPGESSEPLFTSVTFDVLMGNDYQNATASIDVCAYATQVANNGNTVFQAKGWPAD